MNQGDWVMLPEIWSCATVSFNLFATDFGFPNIRFYYFSNDPTLSLLVFMVKARANNKIKQSLILLFKALLIFLSLRFYTTNILLFYLFFEASLIPIFWIVIGWGYQPERLLARLIIFFYTLASSFPRDKSIREVSNFYILNINRLHGVL